MAADELIDIAEFFLADIANFLAVIANVSVAAKMYEIAAKQTNFLNL